MFADHAQQGIQADPGDHAFEQGRIVRSSPRPHRGLGALFDEAVHQRRVAGRDRSSRRQMTENTRMALILILDDSPTEVFVMQKALEKHGFKTAAAENGEEGVRKAKAMKPDLIFIDIVMPRLNRYQATRMLITAPETSLIPIITLTTKGQETDRAWGLRQVAVGYLPNT